MDNETNNHTWVYRYVYWDTDGRVEKTSHIYATLDAIRLGLGRAVNESAIRVNNEDVAGGIYIPPAEAHGDDQSNAHVTAALMAESSNNGSPSSDMGTQ